ncbi:ABC transporter, permease protein [Marvinbryantia formatexigens DSM 14469]|uniref:ABC transporter, permease protein n=2 Tax=Marvinbryantia TaxID=248744 RepID=C6LHQ8_9FIRM|nr:carbohydrate ABC transporter permease [Marvinbryantia formatexigens]EET59798.1 ABC transporter, permease protein [Marvinbryantia formatexigens DSM 14469]SDG41231.1 multiple sugar transport system permease protein [Marvinbryantia formatexigens]
MNKELVYKKVFGTVMRGLLIFVVSFIILLPLYWIFISSITPSAELFQSPIDYLPDHPTLENYKYLIENVGLLEKVGNTVIIVGLTILVSTVLCVLAAYAFSRFKSRTVSLAFGFIIATMLIPDIVLARPLYTFMQEVKLYDTYPGLIILYISAVIPFTVLILRNFVGEIPEALEEAAAIDGATLLQRVFYVIIPLMKPAIATVCIINFITCLNNFFTPLFFANNIQVLSVSIVQLPLRNNMYAVPWDLVSAMGWIILLPIIIFVAVFEKQIMEGIMAGGVKA